MSISSSMNLQDFSPLIKGSSDIRESNESISEV